MYILWGIYNPPRFSQKGGPGCPPSLLRRGPVCPNTVPDKKKEGVRARHGCGCHASVAELNFRPFGASAGTFRGRVFSVPPNDQTTWGYTPL